MTSDDKNMAMLDWELSTIGDPLADFGYHCLLWHIGNIELYPDALVEVFNRWGDRIFAAKNYTNAWSSAWNGNYEGKPLPSATYYYVITLNNGESPYKGNVTIVR